jgi:hypothetical protein
MMYNKKLWSQRSTAMSIPLILAFSAALLLAPLSPTLNAGADIAMHLYNSHQFLEALRSGIIYPRWLDDWYGGYGAPIGVAYPPLMYYGAGLLGLAGISPLIGLKILLWLALFSSGCVMYLLANRFMDWRGALAAGLLYQAAPYRMIDLYSRGALPEFIAFVWPPLLLLMIYLCLTGKKPVYYLLLTLAIAGLLLTHLLIAYLVAITFTPITLYLLWKLPRSTIHPIKLIVPLIAASALGVLLAAVYWLPLLLENQYMNTAWLEHLTPGFLPEGQAWGNYLNNFLLNSQVYLGTVMQEAYQDNLIISGAAVLTLMPGVLDTVLLVKERDEYRKDARLISTVMVALLIFSVFMATSLSQSLWTLLPQLRIIQFPWRWLTITSFAGAYMGGETLAWTLRQIHIKKGFSFKNHPARIALTGLAVAAYIGGSIIIIKIYHAPLSKEIIARLTSENNVTPELYPWVYDDFYMPAASVGFDYTTQPSPKQPEIVGSHPVELEVTIWQPLQRILHVKAQEDTQIHIPTFWFPGWEAHLDQQPEEIEVQPGSGTMLITVPAGQHQISLTFTDTPARLFGAVISLIAVLILLTAIVSQLIHLQIEKTFFEHYKRLQGISS